MKMYSLTKETIDKLTEFIVMSNVFFEESFDEESKYYKNLYNDAKKSLFKELDEQNYE